MLFKDELWRVFAPSGAAAEATETEEGDDAPADETPEVSEDASAEAEPEPEPEQPDPLAEFRQQYGITDEDPAAFQKRFSEINRQAQEAERYRQYSAVLWQQMETQRQIAAQSQPKPQAPAWQAPWGKAPDFDPSKLNQITAEDLQNDLMLKKQYQDYVQWQQKGQQALLTDPVGALWGGMEQRIQQTAHQIAQQAINQYRVQSELKAFENANRDWIYDGNGQMTAAAHMWNQHYRQALQIGLQDPIAYAEQALNAEAYRIRIQEDAEAADRPAPQSDAEKKQAFLRGAARQPNRSGTHPRKTRTTPAQNSKRDPWDELKEQMEQLPADDWRQ